MKRPKKNGAEEIDEHNQATEPFDFGVSPYAPTVTGDRLPPETPPIAMVRPRSQQLMPAQPPLIGAYPFLPSAPVQQNGQAASPVVGVVPPQAGGVRASVPVGRGVRKVFPVLVGFCFVVIQMVLLVSLGLKVVGQWDNTLWANVLYVISDIFVWPVQALVHQFSLPFAISTQIITLVTILLYGVISRIVVRCLKLLLHSRQAA
jgi:hypothetical protein